MSDPTFRAVHDRALSIGDEDTLAVVRDVEVGPAYRTPTVSRSGLRETVRTRLADDYESIWLWADDRRVVVTDHRRPNAGDHVHMDTFGADCYRLAAVKPTGQATRSLVDRALLVGALDHLGGDRVGLAVADGLPVVVRGASEAVAIAPLRTDADPAPDEHDRDVKFVTDGGAADESPTVYVVSNAQGQGSIGVSCHPGVSPDQGHLDPAGETPGGRPDAGAVWVTRLLRRRRCPPDGVRVAKVVRPRGRTRAGRLAARSGQSVDHRRGRVHRPLSATDRRGLLASVRGVVGVINPSELSNEEIRAILNTRMFQKALAYRRLAAGIEALEDGDRIFESLVGTITKRHSQVRSEESTREFFQLFRSEVEAFTEQPVAEDDGADSADRQQMIDDQLVDEEGGDVA